MRKKYGPTCLKVLDVWVEKYGFPEGGSLIMEELKKLELKLKLEDEKVKKWRRQRRKDMQMIRAHERCFACWEKEAEIRERKQMRKLGNNTVRWRTVGEEIGPDDTHIHAHIHSPGVRRGNNEGSENTHSHTQMHPSVCILLS